MLYQHIVVYITYIKWHIRQIVKYLLVLSTYDRISITDFKYYQSAKEATTMTKSCFPLSCFSSCFSFSAGCKKHADLNKDGKVDINDLETAASMLEAHLAVGTAVAGQYISEFNGKVNKLISFLNAAKIIFGADPTAISSIEAAIKVLQIFQLSTAAANSIAQDVKSVTIPSDVNQMGDTITTMQKTSLTVQSYMAMFREAGINFGVTKEQFSAVDASLNKLSSMQKAWVVLSNVPAITDTAQTTAATPALAMT